VVYIRTPRVEALHPSIAIRTLHDTFIELIDLEEMTCILLNVAGERRCWTFASLAQPRWVVGAWQAIAVVGAILWYYISM
jgi:hypothetical protein